MDIYIGYNLKDDFSAVIQKAADAAGAKYMGISHPDELNQTDLTGKLFLAGILSGKSEAKALRRKTGSGAVLVGITTGDISTGEAFDAVFLKDDLSIDEFRQIIRIFGNIQHKHSSPGHLEAANRRLSVIHELTRFALNNHSETEIRTFLIQKLTEFYHARQTSFLKYDEHGDLYLQSRSDAAGKVTHHINQKIENPDEYQVCVDCSEPIINCYCDDDVEFLYFCAPIYSGQNITGLLRVEHQNEEVDLSVDRMVLKIAADILAAVRLREKSETALLESEKRARTILETTVDAIITIDEHGSIESYNKAAQRLFGYTFDEVHGRNVKMLMPSPYREEHDEYLNRYQQTGERQIIGIGREVSGQRKDGTTFPMYLAVSEFKLGEKRMYTGIVRDLTEERRLEKEVMRISEHERHRIGQDLHDGLGQMLSGIGLLTKRVLKKLREEKNSLTESVEEIANLIDEADDYSRGLAGGLIKIDLDTGGFNAAIENLARQSERLFRIQCTVKANSEIHLTERTTAEHLYRIIQEAINNAVKHGQATKVTVSIAESTHYFRFRISDNGTGFPSDWRSHKGLGVRIMEFRARLIGATLDISKAPKSGAAITCTLQNTEAR